MVKSEFRNKDFLKSKGKKFETNQYQDVIKYYLGTLAPYDETHVQVKRNSYRHLICDNCLRLA